LRALASVSVNLSRTSSFQQECSVEISEKIWKEGWGQVRCAYVWVSVSVSVLCRLADRKSCAFAAASITSLN